MSMNKARNGEPRVNKEIDVAKVRLVDEKGQMLGIVPFIEALRKAEASGLDLVEIAPNADPPVCKILDYGKYRYEIQKKAHEARKKQKVITIKEIKLRPTIDKNDLETKLRSVHKFLEEGDKVKVSLRFRGREMAHQEIGRQLFQRIQEELTDCVRIEQMPRMEGSQLIMILAPK